MEAASSVATAVAVEPEPVVEPANDEISLTTLRERGTDGVGRGRAARAGAQPGRRRVAGAWREVTVKVGMSQVLIDVALGAEPKRIIQASLSQAAQRPLKFKMISGTRRR